jgi:hypothetical protein
MDVVRLGWEMPLWRAADVKFSVSARFKKYFI